MKQGLRNFLQPPVTLSLLGPGTFLSTLFLNTLSLRYSLNVTIPSSHPYKTARSTDLYISIFYVLYNKQEDIKF
jgi:hypothetical protein